MPRAYANWPIGSWTGMRWSRPRSFMAWQQCSSTSYRRHLPICMPPDVASRLRNICRDSARQNLVLTSQLLALLDAFAAHGIAVVPLKGPAMAESLYPGPELRPSSDLDLLVRKRDIEGAVSVLAQEGYALGANMQRLPLRVLLRLNCELFFHRLAHGACGLAMGDRPCALSLPHRTGDAVAFAGPHPDGGQGSPMPFAGSPVVVSVRSRHKTHVVASSVAGGRRPAGANSPWTGTPFWSWRKRRDA